MITWQIIFFQMNLIFNHHKLKHEDAHTSPIYSFKTRDQDKILLQRNLLYDVLHGIHSKNVLHLTFRQPTVNSAHLTFLSHTFAKVTFEVTKSEIISFSDIRGEN